MTILTVSQFQCLIIVHMFVKPFSKDGMTFPEIYVMLEYELKNIGFLKLHVMFEEI